MKYVNIQNQIMAQTRLDMGKNQHFISFATEKAIKIKLHPNARNVENAETMF